MKKGTKPTMDEIAPGKWVKTRLCSTMLKITNTFTPSQNALARRSKNQFKAVGYFLNARGKEIEEVFYPNLTDVFYCTTKQA